VFLDRDGTIIEDVGYLDAIERMAVYPWSIDSIRALNRAGLPVVVVTNQSGVARQYITGAFVEETHRALDRQLSAGGARIDAYYYCPHHPDGTVVEYRRQCDCRKPATGLVDRAARELGLDVERSFVVGATSHWGAPWARARSSCAPAPAPSKRRGRPRILPPTSSWIILPPRQVGYWDRSNITRC
jgi:D,D-heptose 1,7-bisphosphate phosphatase